MENPLHARENPTNCIAQLLEVLVVVVAVVVEPSLPVVECGNGDFDEFTELLHREATLTIFLKPNKSHSSAL